MGTLNPHQVQDILDLVDKARSGDPQAQDLLGERLLTALHPFAKQLLRRSSPGSTLRTDDLVQEVALSLLGQEGLAKWPGDPNHVRPWLHTVMHNHLISSIRKRNALKRGGGHKRVPLDDLVDYYGQRVNGSLDHLIDALEKLRAVSPLQESIARLVVFSECTPPEIAELLGLPHEQVEKEWRLAQARLLVALKKSLRS
jgi:RNA polymerase sigma factor (TIGR02999 family)